MHTNSTRPGLIVVDASLGVIAYNGEALQILSYPEHPSKIRQIDSWLTGKVRSDLTGVHNGPHPQSRFVLEFRSARRLYRCRSFALDWRANNGHGANPTGGLQIVMLERTSNGTVKINEISRRFGLTAREGETVQYLLEGLTSKEIAQRMGISPNTVKAFLRLVMVKMNVTTRSGIIGRIVGPAHDASTGNG
ncbi:MAG TPA: LuxR C-terminal-related transcriptional regulator [Candidatus Binatia bacterium]|nr:LuxR C-terminal-related transcriptional regulator [Candidatus Binatia bacterium]